MKTFEVDGVLFPYSSREKRYVYEYQIKKEFPKFYHKVETILTGGKYSPKSVDIASSILEQMSDEGSISWKQFDLIMNILPSDFCKDGHLVRSRIYKNSSRDIFYGVFSPVFYADDFYSESQFMSHLQDQQVNSDSVYRNHTDDNLEEE